MDLNKIVELEVDENKEPTIPGVVRDRLETESSLLNWYPLLKGVLPAPKTEIMMIDRMIAWGLLDSRALRGEGYPGDVADLETMHKSIKAHAAKIGYPLFVRTDQASDKYGWKNSSYVEQESDLIDHVARVIEHNECASFRGLPWRALVFREYVPLESRFVAFHGDLPISRERRYFVNNGSVVCHHAYWCEEAIADWHRFYERHDRAVLPANWRNVLEELNFEGYVEVEELWKMATTFSKAVPGKWSVDFAHTADGRWILIDAARAELSWHPEDCPSYKEMGWQGV